MKARDETAGRDDGLAINKFYAQDRTPELAVDWYLHDQRRGRVIPKRLGLNDDRLATVAVVDTARATVRRDTRGIRRRGDRRRSRRR
jgi:hypothetical protein